jgi:hypothetical protein
MRIPGSALHVEDMRGAGGLGKHHVEDSEFFGQGSRTVPAEPLQGQPPPQRAHRPFSPGDGAALLYEEAGRNMAVVFDVL